MSQSDLDPGAVAASLRVRAGFNFLIFSAVAAGGGWAFVALDRASGQLSGEGAASASALAGSTSGQGLWILVPAITAMLLRWLSRDGGGGLGLGLPTRSALAWFGFSLLAFPLFALAAILAVGATGLAAVQAPSPGWISVAAASIAFLFLKNILEELIFRGYGTRTAVAMGLRGIWPHVAVGTVWALWHLPLYLAWMPPAAMAQVTSLPLALFLPLFLAGVICLAAFYGELRRITGSIWPGVVLHTTANVVGAALLTEGMVAYAPMGEVLLGVMPNALASMLVFGGLAVWLAHRRRMQVLGGAAVA
jgi:membrane protease YdiL (CAAX protease family)